MYVCMCACVHVCVQKKERAALSSPPRHCWDWEWETVESGKRDKSPLLTFERAAIHSNNPPRWGWGMEGWWRGGRDPRESEHVWVFTLPTKEKKGRTVVLPRKIRLERWRAEARPLDQYALVVITAVFSLFHNKPTTTFHCKCSNCLFPYSLLFQVDQNLVSLPFIVSLHPASSSLRFEHWEFRFMRLH